MVEVDRSVVRRGVTNSMKDVAKDRFDLINGQFFANYLYKNLWWVLDGATIGYGDIRIEDIERIGENLKAGEEFVGWNEHHGSRFQQTNTPMLRITQDKTSLRGEIVEKEGR